MPNHRKIAFLTIILAALALNSFSQQYRRSYRGGRDFAWLARHWSLQWNVGPGMYFGDLSQYDADPFGKIKHESKLSTSLVASNKFHPFMAFQFRTFLGRYKAENTSFNRRLDGYAYMFGANMMFDLVNLMSYPKEYDPDIYIYILAGVGLMRMRPELSNNFSGEIIDGLNVQARADLAPYYGVGANKYLTGSWDLAFELVIFKVQSDKLDGVTVTDENDQLVYASIGLKYNFEDLMNLKKYRYRRNKPVLRR